MNPKGTVLLVKLTGTASNRDACGAVVTAVTSKGQRVYRKSIGEGLSSQNSAAIRVTLGEGEELKKLKVRWPSGKVSEHEPSGGATNIVEPDSQ